MPGTEYENSSTFAVWFPPHIQVYPTTHKLMCPMSTHMSISATIPANLQASASKIEGVRECV
eukprot:m.340017 g.340017  ORF g.340017 m.340017 type:complete len:62 (+) comp16098_c0_seq6:5224-5409(+)